MAKVKPEDSVKFRNIDTTTPVADYGLSPQLVRQAKAYLVKPTFQFYASSHRKYTSVQKPHVRDPLLPEFITNRYVKDPHEVELTRDSSLLQGSQNTLKNLPQIGAGSLTASQKYMRNKSLMNESPQKTEDLMKSLPKSFNFIKKNKIQLLKQYIGEEEAKRQGIGPNSS